MRPTTQKYILYAIGTFLFLIGIIAIFNTLQTENPYGIFWFCYAGLILSGIAIFKRNSLLLITQINILLIPFIVWDLDFILNLLGLISPSIPNFGVTRYFFVTGPLLGKLITLQHLFTIPLALYALYLIKQDQKSVWKISLIQMAAIFFVTLLVTPEQNNVNCVYRSCVDGLNFAGFYPIAWFVIAFISVFIVNHIIVNAKLFQRNKFI